MLIHVDQLEEGLKEEGIMFHKVIPMSGKRIVIHFKKLEELERFLTENYSTVTQRFSMIQKWREEEALIVRSVWLGIVDLPFMGWSEENFKKKIIEPYGSNLKWDDIIMQFTGVGRVRVLVETNKDERISETLKEEVEDDLGSTASHREKENEETNPPDVDRRWQDDGVVQAEAPVNIVSAGVKGQERKREDRNSNSSRDEVAITRSAKKAEVVVARKQQDKGNEKKR
ncbi:hypothetical protein QQ045_025640 [Rhodiola kirilowii]